MMDNKFVLEDELGHCGLASTASLSPFPNVKQNKQKAYDQVSER